MPDIFAGKPFPLDEFPPKDKGAIMKFFERVDPLTPPAIEKVRCRWWTVWLSLPVVWYHRHCSPLASRTTIIQPHTPNLQCKAHFREVGLTGKFGIVGFCWGGGVAVKCASDADFGAAATAHPARVDKCTQNL